MSETIELNKFGGSTVIVDLLIENSGTSNLEEIYLLYPNVFLEPHNTKHKKPIYSGSIEDISTTFHPKVHPNNRYYLNEDWSFDYSKDNRSLTIKESTIAHPNKEAYDGLIQRIDKDNDHDIQQLDIFPLPDEEVWSLFLIKFSILHKKLTFELKPGKALWQRYKFSTKISCIAPPSKLIRTGLRFINDLRFHYEIFGPYEIAHRFDERLRFLKNAFDEKSLKEDPQMLRYFKISDTQANDIVTGCENLIKFLAKRQSTVYQNSYLHIMPKSIRTLTDFMKIGMVEPLGTIPNYLDNQELKRRTSEVFPSKFSIADFLSRNRQANNRIYDWVWAGDLSYDLCENTIKKCILINGKDADKDKIEELCKASSCTVKSDPYFKLYFIGKAQNYMFKGSIFFCLAFIFIKLALMCHNLFYFSARTFFSKNVIVSNHFAAENALLFNIAFAGCWFIAWTLLILPFYKVIKRHWKRL